MMERTRTQKKHMVEVYYCKKKRQGCNYAVVVRLNNADSADEQSSVVEERVVEHNHENAKNPLLAEPVKQFILQNMSKSSTIILRLLEKERPGEPKPTKKQVENFMNRERKKNGTRGELTEFTLEQEARKYPRNDDEPDKPFVTYTGLPQYGTNGKFDFVLSFTTPNLMKKQQEHDNPQADATHRMFWNKFPILLLGFSDASRRFHPTIWAVASRESEVTYSTIFKEIRNFDPEKIYTPKIVMGDGHAGITNAAEVFGNETERMMCYFHLKERVKKKLPSLKISKMLKEKIKKDIEQLRGAASSEEFEKAAPFMLADWRLAKIPEEFISYFEDQYIDSRSQLHKWFAGMSDYGTTNNALEGKNNALKNQVTERKLWTIMELFPKMIEETKNFWKEYEDVKQKLPVSHQEFLDGFKF
uniref:MULE transposase domain-containing protein n=1 Tax=Panagrolaimus sp. JU765 TaxID=591449 RepID=A0AC34PWF5_9BILA